MKNFFIFLLSFFFYSHAQEYVTFNCEFKAKKEGYVDRSYSYNFMIYKGTLFNEDGSSGNKHNHYIYAKEVPNYWPNALYFCFYDGSEYKNVEIYSYEWKLGTTKTWKYNSGVLTCMISKDTTEKNIKKDYFQDQLETEKRIDKATNSILASYIVLSFLSTAIFSTILLTK